jgi:hypothetical protein
VAHCQECGEYFYRGPDEWWKRLCLDCWKERKNSGSNYHQEIERLEGRIEELETENWRLRSQIPAVNMFDELRNKPFRDFILSNLKFLIFACHPDRNRGSAEANEVTRQLLELKNENPRGGAGFARN